MKVLKWYNYIFHLFARSVNLRALQTPYLHPRIIPLGGTLFHLRTS